MDKPLTFDKNEDRCYLQYGRTILGMSTNKQISFNEILNNSQLILEKEQQRQQVHKSSNGVSNNTSSQHNPNPLHNSMINTGIPNLHQVNMQVHMENQYMNNLM